MNWQFSKHPKPEFSANWSDQSWPPADWYITSHAAMDKIELKWGFDNFEASAKIIDNLTEDQFLLWAVQNIVGQICNGGFSQALYNSYGELAEEAVPGLRKFGFANLADIVEKAWGLFGIRPIPRDRIARIERLEELAKLEEQNLSNAEFIQHASAVFQGTEDNWSALEKEFFGFYNAKTGDEGYAPAYFKPLAEYVHKHRDRFFIL